ncbi:hypothetical protein C5C07_14000 [Haloferax sp. Atlit-4N]|nr:hypothetical protein C5C07_14000 [Haloferax sp. Atlit-4N]
MLRVSKSVSGIQFLLPTHMARVVPFEFHSLRETRERMNRMVGQFSFILITDCLGIVEVEANVRSLLASVETLEFLEDTS